MSEPKQPTEVPASQAPALVGQTLEHIKQQPVKAVGSAFLVGFILSLFPVGRIIGGVISLLLTVLRPALMIFGAFKVWEEIGRRQSKPDVGGGQA
jgi:hypothetical protein